MNFPYNIPKQMKENTKDFQRYLKILESSNQRKCPKSLNIIIFIITVLDGVIPPPLKKILKTFSWTLHSTPFKFGKIFLSKIPLIFKNYRKSRNIIPSKFLNFLDENNRIITPVFLKKMNDNIR